LHLTSELFISYYPTNKSIRTMKRKKIVDTVDVADNDIADTSVNQHDM